MQLKLSEPMLNKLSDALGFTVTDVCEHDGDLRIYGYPGYAEGTLNFDFVARRIEIKIYFLNTDFLDEDLEVLLDF